MSDDDRKSMDDVLASIRRIVRTEKQDADAGEPAYGGREGLVQENDAEEPLVLTPDMRTDLGSDPGHDPGAEHAGGATELDADISDASAWPEAGLPDAGLPDPEALRAMLREIVREELHDALGEALSNGRAGDAVREIVRDELVHGEIGDNISQNVLRLIRDEVRRAVGER